jgi:hypothetical protein
MNDPFELLCFDLTTAALRRVFNQLKAAMALKAGALCFSRSWHNPLLWSHYGDKHKGVCLGFDVPDEFLILIDYTPIRLPLVDDSGNKVPLDESFARRLGNTKYEGWKYEEEVRVRVSLDEGGRRKRFFYKEFGPELTQKEVITGPLFPQGPQFENLRTSCPTYVNLVRSRLAFRSFDVVEDRRGF